MSDKLKSFNQKYLYHIEKNIFSLLRKKYLLKNDYYGAVIINNIIYNEKTHLVAKFKDYLIEDDFSEFLKRYYRKLESVFRLPKYLEYYEKFSKIFPNYTALKEAKYIYKNIHKKQKMIDLQQEMEESQEEKSNQKLYNNQSLSHQRKKNKQDIFFNSDIYNSIMKQSQDLYKLLFGIEKNSEQNESSIIGINEIINLIDNYSKLEFNYNGDITKMKYLNNKKISLKKYNNSSLLTKQSTVNSSINKKYLNFENININKNNNNLLIRLKKYSNEKNTKAKKENLKDFINIRKKHISSTLFCEIDKSDIKNFEKNKFIKLNENNKKRINFIKEKLRRINSNYKTINQNSIRNKKNKNILTERSSYHNRYNTLNSGSNNMQYIEKFISQNKFNNSSKNSKFKDKKSIDKKNNSKSISKNSFNLNNKIYTNTITCQPIKKSKNFFNKINNRIINENRNKKLNIANLQKLLKYKNIKKCQTERNSISNIPIEKLNQKTSILKNNIFKKGPSYKTSNPSIEMNTHKNKTLLLSNKKIVKNKINMKYLTLTSSPKPKENIKINKIKLFKMSKGKINLNLNTIFDNKTIDKKRNYPINDKDCKTENYKKNKGIFSKQKKSNNFPLVKDAKMKNFNTVINIGLAKKIINNNKHNFVSNKQK